MYTLYMCMRYTVSPTYTTCSLYTVHVHEIHCITHLYYMYMYTVHVHEIHCITHLYYMYMYTVHVRL